MIRDDEIKRLILYAKALGAKVVIRNYSWDYSGEAIFEPKYTININKKFHNNKTEIIMTLLHEISHLKYHILNDYKFSDSFLEEVWELESKNKKIPKKATNDIAQFEINSLELMEDIANELSIKIPMWKILKQKKQDQWVYKYLDQYGFFPKIKEVNKNLKKLAKKYKNV